MNANQSEPDVLKSFSRDGRDYIVEDRGDVLVEVNVRTGHERVTHTEDFRAAFDLTRTWGRDVWHDLMDKFGLEFVELEIGPDAEDKKTVFAWVGEDVLLTTTNNPLTGERANYHDKKHREAWDPSSRLAYCGYIHLEGEESAVREAVEHIKNNSTYKEVSVGHWCV